MKIVSLPLSAMKSVPEIYTCIFSPPPIMARAGYAMLELAHVQYLVGDKRVLQNVSARFLGRAHNRHYRTKWGRQNLALRVAAGLAQVSAGTVMAHGDFADAGWRAKNIAYMPQFQSVAWPLSGARHCGIGFASAQSGRGGKRKAH